MHGHPVLLLAVLIVGCGGPARDVELPGYTVHIPEDVPERVLITDKDGTKRAANARELYARGHRSGWRSCWEGQRKGWVHLEDDQDWQRFVPQDDAPAQQGFEVGFVQCQRRLREQP